MLGKIQTVKGLGLVFQDFSWAATTPQFKQVNLIYGWNGCGKTTLTRLFDLIAGPIQSDVEYELLNKDGVTYRHTDAYPIPIRVFNQDYIQSNVRILESRANKISLLLGEANQDLVDQITVDETKLNGDAANPDSPGLIYEARRLDDELVRLNKAQETAFTDIARTIAAAIGIGSTARNYRRPDAIRDFERLASTSAPSQRDYDAATQILRQEPLPEIAPIILGPLDPATAGPDALQAIGWCQNEALNISKKTVEAEIISRLASNPELNEWVEQGYHIHEQMKSSACQFCGNDISIDRIAALSRHFSEADKLLKAEIESTLQLLRSAYAVLDRTTLPDPARFYQEMRLNAEYLHEAFESQKLSILPNIVALGKALADKRSRTTESIDLKSDFSVTPLIQAIIDMNGLIERHCAKTREFEKDQRAALQIVKAYHLSKIRKDVGQRADLITSTAAQIAILTGEITQIRSRVSDARAQISSAHKACDQINKGLTNFLGRSELTFAPSFASVPDHNDEIVGYQILRNGSPAVHLSEGEKTAIAFVYFTVHLSDGQFRHCDSMVVIDDPISSLDSAAVYQAFSFLKNAVKECKQTYVLTHNFEFLKLLLNWRSRHQDKTSYFMIVNRYENDRRNAAIVQMDKELRSYESEYHYIFKQLKLMRSEQDGTIAKAYPVPNMARKLWESFLIFRVPNGESVHAKMDVLRQAGVEHQKLDAIYKFTNDQSHITGAGFDPSLVPEAQRVIGAIFDVMRATAGDHFRILDAATND